MIIFRRHQEQEHHPEQLILKENIKTSQQHHISQGKYPKRVDTQNQSKRYLLISSTNPHPTREKEQLKYKKSLKLHHKEVHLKEQVLLLGLSWIVSYQCWILLKLGQLEVAWHLNSWPFLWHLLTKYNPLNSHKVGLYNDLSWSYLVIKIIMLYIVWPNANWLAKIRKIKFIY